MYNFKSNITYNDLVSGSSLKTEKSKKQGIYNTLADIDSKYSDSGSGLGLKKLSESSVKGDGEIAGQAESLLGGAYLAGSAKIDDSYKTKAQSEQDRQKSAQENFSALAASIEKQYGARKTAAENDALKRGLARSSVIVKAIEDFDDKKIKDITELEQQMLSAVSDSENRIAQLQREKEDALKNFELSHAADVQAKIYELTKERDKQLDDIIKYNNTVQEKEVKFTADSGGKTAESANQYQAQQEKVAALKDYFGNMSKEDAVTALTGDAQLKAHLGSYYNYMLNYLLNRKD